MPDRSPDPQDAAPEADDAAAALPDTFPESVSVGDAFGALVDLPPREQRVCLEALRRSHPQVHREVVSLLPFDGENTLIEFAKPNRPPRKPSADATPLDGPTPRDEIDLRSDSTVSSQYDVETQSVPAAGGPPSGQAASTDGLIDARDLRSDSGLPPEESRDVTARAGKTLTVVSGDPTLHDSQPARRRGLIVSARRFAFGTVRGRALLLGSLLATALIVGGWVLERRVADSLTRQTGDQLQVLVEQQAGGIAAWTRGRTRDVELYGRDPDVRQAILELIDAAENVDPKTLPEHPAQQRLRDALETATGFPTDGPETFPHTEGVRYAVWNRNREQIGDWTLNPESYARLEARSGAGPLVDVFAGRSVAYIPGDGPYTDLDGFLLPPEIAFTAPIWGTDSRTGRPTVIAALLVGGIFQREFDELLESGTFGPSGETYAVNAEGRLVSPSRFGETLDAFGWPQVGRDNVTVGVSVADPGRDLVAALAAGRLDPEAAAEANAAGEPTRMIDRLIGADRTVRILEPYRDYRGVPVVGAGRWLDEVGLGLVAEVDASQAFESLDLVTLAGRLGLLGLAATCGLALLLALHSWRLQRRAAREQRLGAYILQDVLGEGGMGTVWKASHDLLRRPTAVKVLKEELKDELSAARFEREVRLASRLQSPHTIDIYDYGVTDTGRFYCAMALLDGLTLRELVARHGLVGPSRAVHIMRQIAQSLREAHGQGLVHRDIKPANVMLCDRGGQPDWVIVLDFGLAKEIAPGRGGNVTNTTMLIGTPDFIAPERIREPSLVDPRSDLYAVGVLSYFLVAGIPCFETTSQLDALEKALYSDPPPPSRAVPSANIPPEFDAIILDLLRKEPEDRIGSAAELLDRLDALTLPHWTDADARKWWDRTVGRGSAPDERQG